jgi:hypothetical protein
MLPAYLLSLNLTTLSSYQPWCNIDKERNAKRAVTAMWWNHLLSEALVLHTRRRTYLFSSSSSSSPRAKLQKNHNAAHQPRALYTKPSPYTPDVSTLSNSMFTSRPPRTAELNSLSLSLLTCPSPRPSVRSTISNPIQTPGHTKAAQSNPPRF